LRVASNDARVAEWIGLGIPVNSVDMSYLAADRKPKLIVHGGKDQFGAREKIEALFAALAEPKRLAIVEGADHFFTGQLGEVRAAIESWFDERHPRLPAAADSEPD
jgi:uncharacterized protein